ncbi:MAG: hypothetical protein P1V35_03480 [Planctomycetota bacterium]|nr:hypothetical protein [Planctomycetota bacterium]
MSRPRAESWVLGLLVGMLAFFMYGGCRAMAEVIGFEWWVTRTSLLITVLYVSFAVAVYYLTRTFFGTRPKGCKLLAVSCAMTLVGATASEITLLVDERDFLQTVEHLERSSRPETYNRDRVWPFSGTSLLWSRSRGVWAID